VEGALRLLKIHPGWIIQDNNLLASSLPSLLYTETQARRHFDDVFTMLREQKRRIYFNGGLDKYFLRPWHVEYFDSISIGELWWACDRPEDLKALSRVKELLPHVPLRKMRCYTMIPYENETLSQAEQRIEKVFEMGFVPFSQLYQPPVGNQPSIVYSADWKALNRKWCRQAAMFASEDYEQVSGGGYKTTQPILPMFPEATP
jgi:hypothetical protein